MKCLVVAMLIANVVASIAFAEESTAIMGSRQDLLTTYHQAQQNDAAWASAQKSNLAAQQKIVQGKALLLPTVGLSVNGNHSDTDIRYTGTDNVFRNSGKEHFNTYGYTLNVSQPIYRPQNTIQYEEAKTQAAYADVQLGGAQQDLAIRTVQAYFEVLIAEERITLINAQKIAIRQALQQANASFKAGVATITDVNDAQARLDLLVAQEIAAQNTVEDKRHAIEMITNIPPLRLAKVQGEIKARMIEPTDVNSWIDTALHNNPELNAQQKNLELADQEVSRTRAAHLPTVDAVGSYNYTSANGGINGFGNDLKNLTVGIQMQMPLYQGGALQSKQVEATYNYQKAQDDLEETRRKIVMQTKQAWLNLSSIVAQVYAYEQALNSSQLQWDSTNKGYKVGVRTSVDVLNAQQQYFSAKRDLMEARYTYLVNILKLKLAAGTLSEQDLVQVNQTLIN